MRRADLVSGASYDQRRCRGDRQPFSYPLIGAAVDSPGHFPNVGRTIAMLVAAGADVNARCAGPHQETPLQGSASSDDLEALDALLDAGADIEAPGAVIERTSPPVRPIASGPPSSMTVRRPAAAWVMKNVLAIGWTYDGMTSIEREGVGGGCGGHSVCV